jgi:hypothetical protein
VVVGQRAAPLPTGAGSGGGGSAGLGEEAQAGEKAKDRGEEQVGARWSQEAEDQSVWEVLRMAGALFPEEVRGKEELVKETVRAAYKMADGLFGEKEAVDWADGFSIPEEAVRHDESLLRSAGLDFDAMVRRRLKDLAGQRLSRQRVESCISKENPERDKLLRLAETGMPLLLDPDHVPNGVGKWPKLRRAYQAVASAVDKMFFENFHAKGLAFVLTTATVRTIVKDCGLFPASWCPKAYKKSGRPLGDCSDGGSEPGNSPINSEYTKQASDEEWGGVKHPTIEQFSRMILRFYREAVAKDPSVKWTDLVIWKMDLRGAYNLISFATGDVRYVASELSGDKVMFFLCGIFGWTGTPAAFQVVTRAISWELEQVLVGLMLMYVDDMVGVCLRKDVEGELAKARQLCTSLLGDNAVEELKTEVGRRTTVIGYLFDLDSVLERAVVSIAPKNVLRAMHGFMVVDLSKRVPVPTMQKLASWGSRYDRICVYMRPFVRVLHRQYAGRRQQCSLMYDEDGCRVVRIFRVLLLLTTINEQKFARRLVSFEVGAHKLVVEFDASLTGVGLLWFLVDDNGVEVPLGGSAVDLTPLGFGEDASYQNTAEFIAAVLGMRGLSKLGYEGCPVLLRGDSKSALSWAYTDRFRSDLVGPAASVFILQNIASGNEVVDHQHLPAARNWRADGLSRGKSLDFLVEEDPSLAGVPWIELDAQELVLLCDPRQSWSSDDEFSVFWGRVKGLLKG